MEHIGQVSTGTSIQQLALVGENGQSLCYAKKQLKTIKTIVMNTQNTSNKFISK